MDFRDLLSQPLPSQRNSFMEGFEDDDDDSSTDNIPIDDTEECGEPTYEDDDIGLDDIDPDDLSDDELEKLDSELGGDVIDDLDDDIDDVDDDDDIDDPEPEDGEGEVKLSPGEEMHADDMMSVAATSMLVNDELNADEKESFIESEALTAIEEGFMTEADVNELAESVGVVTEANNYTKKMIIRLDANAKKKQLYALAVNVSAAAKHDPDYIKLKKVMKMRKILRAKLDRKYHNVAMKRMKVYFARLRRSNSSSLSKIGNKYSKR